MRNLLNFLARYYFVWLFLLLECLALLLLYHHQQYHRSFFINSANRISATVFRLQDQTSRYFSLQQENKLLAEQNNRLLSENPASFLKTDQDVFVFNDTLYQRRHAYIRSRVINNSVNRRSNYMTLDKGRSHGVSKDMGVITPFGVVGIVKNVSENFSSVISLLHQDMQISVRHQRTDHIGTLSWEGGDYRYAQMSYIPSHVELQNGDSVFTSGYSRMFPPAVFVGLIDGFEQRIGENFNTAIIRLAQDFNKLTYVHVVKDLFAEELDMLEELKNN